MNTFDFTFSGSARLTPVTLSDLRAQLFFYSSHLTGRNG